MKRFNSIQFVICLGVLVLLGRSSSIAAEWVGGNGAFNDDSNWSTGEIPGATEEAAINNGGTAQFSDDIVDNLALRLGAQNGNTGTFEQSGGT
jgi:hypothetical protein